MLSSLIKNNKIWISLIIGCLFAFSTTIFDVNPFLIALFGALIFLKVPILPSFIASIACCIVRGDTTLAVHCAVSVLLFAVLKSYTQDGDNKSLYMKYLLSNIISIVFLLVTNFTNFDLFSNLIILLILEFVFFVVFKTGLKLLFNPKEVKICSNEELLALMIIIVSLSSTFMAFSYKGITIVSLVTTLCVMLSSLKKPTSFSVANALVLTVILGLFQKANIAFFILHTACGIIVSLLSKIGKRGITIGFAFSILIVSISLQKELDIPKIDSVLTDYNKFIESRSGEYVLDDNDLMEVPELKQYTISGVISKQMAIGYLLLMLIPASFYATYKGNAEENQEIQSFKEKMFNKRSNYLLNTGKMLKKKEQKKT